MTGVLRSRRGGSSRPGLTQDDTVVLINSQTSNFSQKSCNEERPPKRTSRIMFEDDEGRPVDDLDYKFKAYTYNCKDEESSHPKLSKKELDKLKQLAEDEEEEG